MISNITKRLKSKTYYFATLVGVGLPVLESHMPLIKQFLTENHLGLYIAISIGIGLMREITHSSIDDK